MRGSASRRRHRRRSVGSSLLRGNGIGIQAAGGASLLSYGNNHVTGNPANGSFTGTARLQ
jgi:hypothetical protein